MKPLSEETRTLIQKLHQGPQLWTKIIGRRDHENNLLAAIAISREALAAPCIAHKLLDESPAVRGAAAKAVSFLLSPLGSHEFVQLDEACRRNWSDQRDAHRAWSELKPSQAEQLRHLPNASFSLGLASFHWSGYTREAAVTALANCQDGTELPFLLLRLNDWVSPIRELSAKAVLDRIKANYLPRFVDHLPLVNRLNECGRSDHAQVLSSIRDLLQAPEAMPYLVTSLSGKNMLLRRLSMKVIAAFPSPAATTAFLDSVKSRDPILRLWACRGLIRCLPANELASHLQQWTMDRSMPIRVAALSAWVERFPSEAQPRLVEALCDRHGSVRAVARHWIQSSQPDYDIASVCRKEAHQPFPKAGAVLGLGETGTKDDAELFFRHLTSPSILLCTAAIRAIGNLDGDRYAETLLASLGSSDIGISNEATRVLRSRTTLVADHLPEFFRVTNPPHVRANAFRLLLQRPYWERGSFLLESLRDLDQRIAQMAGLAFSAWLSKSTAMATNPTASEVGLIRHQLALSSEFVSKPVRDLLEFTLKSFA
jgi:HEAT repeat protein